MKSMKQYRVGARVYVVQILDKNEFVKQLLQSGVNETDVHDVKSFINYDKSEICICDGFSDDHNEELVLHELLHALLDNAQFKQSDVSEEIIKLLAPRLHQFLLDNVFISQ
jgi:hypothetical protein